MCCELNARASEGTVCAPARADSASLCVVVWLRSSSRRRLHSRSRRGRPARVAPSRRRISCEHGRSPHAGREAGAGEASRRCRCSRKVPRSCTSTGTRGRRAGITCSSAATKPSREWAHGLAGRGRGALGPGDSVVSVVSKRPLRTLLSVYNASLLRQRYSHVLRHRSISSMHAGFSSAHTTRSLSLRRLLTEHVRATACVRARHTTSSAASATFNPRSVLGMSSR
jgi:hypothetical protein